MLYPCFTSLSTPCKSLELHKLIPFNFPSRVKHLKGKMAPPRVITLLKSFSNASLVSLMNHEYVAVHVKEFFDPALSHQLALTIEQQYENNECKNWKVTTSQGGLESSDVLTVNTPYNVAQQSQSPKDVEKYFANVKATNDSFRSSGQIHPLDKVSERILVMTCSY